jgi:hypothetical protein
MMAIAYFMALIQREGAYPHLVSRDAQPVRKGSITVSPWTAYTLCRSLDLRHIIMQNSLFAAIVPSDGDTSPIHLCDCASVGLVILPANAVAGFQSSGLCAGHLWALSDLL